MTSKHFLKLKLYNKQNVRPSLLKLIKAFFWQWFVEMLFQSRTNIYSKFYLRVSKQQNSATFIAIYIITHRDKFAPPPGDKYSMMKNTYY